MTEARDVKNLKEVLDLALKGVEIGVMAAKDGQVNFQDLSLLMGLIPVVQPAFADMGEIPAELKDLSEAEAAELVGHVVARLAVDNAKAVAIVEAALKSLASVYGLVKAIQA